MQSRWAPDATEKRRTKKKEMVNSIQSNWLEVGIRISNNCTQKTRKDDATECERVPFSRALRRYVWSISCYNGTVKVFRFVSFMNSFFFCCFCYLFRSIPITDGLVSVNECFAASIKRTAPRQWQSRRWEKRADRNNSNKKRYELTWDGGCVLRTRVVCIFLRFIQFIPNVCISSTRNAWSNLT